jgi:hypothetical protein
MTRSPRGASLAAAACGAALLGAGVLILGGCSAPAPPAPPAATELPTTVQRPAAVEVVSVSREGGLAGGRVTVEVFGTGEWTATDRAGRSTSGRLDQAALADLLRLTAGSLWQAEATRTSSSSCADGYRYRVEFGTGQSVVTDDCLLEGQPKLSGITSTVLAAAGL